MTELDLEEDAAEARYQRVKAALLDALDRNGQDRRTFLDRACGDDTELRREIEALLAEEEATDGFLSTPATLDGTWLEAADTEISTEPAKTPEIEHIGPFRVLGVLGEGGMGRVYLAEQEAPLRRRVALKVIGTALRHRQARSRFAAECAALARLSHPNVASIYEAGTTEPGYPYFAMEWVEGVPITDYCAEHRLDLRARLELFSSVCAGVEHAHQKGVLHRDLKPSNLLVTEIDGRPQAKVIDFGIAKAFDHPLHEGTLLTGDVMIGTPAYLAPELAETASSQDGDTRADVYALGVLLHELVVGVRPFEPQEETLSQWLGRLSQRDPPRPSQRWVALEKTRKQTLAQERRLAPAALERHLRGDLEAILLKATARERAARYGSVAAFAADLGRYLRSEPIEARPASTPYRLGKLVHRRRTLVAAGLLVAIVLLGGVAARTLEARRANREAAAAVAARREAEAAREEAEEISRFLIELFRAARPPGGANALELLELGARKVDLELAGQPRTQVRLKSALGQIYTELGLYDLARRYLDQALALTTAQLADDETATADVRFRLGLVARRQNKLEEAEDHLERALAIYQSRPREDRRLADVVDALGALHVRQGLFEAAEASLERGLEIRQRLLGDDAVPVAQSLNNLANLRFQQARLSEAQTLYERSLEILRQQLGGQHPSVLQALNNLAVVQARQGQLEAAAQRFEQALAVRELLLGTEHPDVAESLNNLGVLYADMKRFEKAEPLHRRALAIREKAFGPAHPSVAWSLDNLSTVLIEQDRAAEAEPLLHRALGIRVAGFGAVHPDVARSHQQIGLLRERQGRLEEARDSFAHALVIRRQVLDSTHPDVGRAALRLAGTLYRLGDLEGAEAQARAAKELLEKTEDVSQEEKAQAAALLAEMLGAGSRGDAAGSGRLESGGAAKPP